MEIISRNVKNSWAFLHTTVAQVSLKKKSPNKYFDKLESINININVAK